MVSAENVPAVLQRKAVDVDIAAVGAVQVLAVQDVKVAWQYRFGCVGDWAAGIGRGQLPMACSPGRSFEC